MKKALILILTSSMVPGRLHAQMECDFRTVAFASAPVNLEGPNAELFVKQDAKGLRITFPEQDGPKTPIGVILKQQPKEDFDVVVEFDLVKAEVPAAGDGVGISLYLMLNSARRDGVTLARIQPPKGGQVYTFRHLQEDRNGKRVQKGSRRQAIVTKSTGGKLRLGREGDVLSAYVAEGDSAEFTLLGSFPIGQEPVRFIRVAADPGNASVPVDVSLSKCSLVSRKAQYFPSPPSSSSSWFFIAASATGAVLVVCLSVAYIRLLLRKPWPDAVDVDHRTVTSRGKSKGE